VDAAPKLDVSQLAGMVEELPDALRIQALTHSSWVPKQAESFGRLAFIGDSVLGLAIALRLFEQFPDAHTGTLSKVHAQVVSGASCSVVGVELGVEEMLRAQEPEIVTAAIPAEVLLDGRRPVPEIAEALIGACLFAFGFERIREAVVAAFEPLIEAAAEEPVDPKSALQQRLARRRTRVSYEVIERVGPPHKPIFKVAAVVDSVRVGEGEGRSKKEAESAAAAEALERLSD
jgi:ribonuclease-3